MAKTRNDFDALSILAPVGYVFQWSPTESGPDLSTAEKVHDYFGFGEWAPVYGRNLVIGSSTASTTGWTTNGWGGSFSTYSSTDRIYYKRSENGWTSAMYHLDSSYSGKMVTLSFKAKIKTDETTATNTSILCSNMSGTNPYYSNGLATGNTDVDGWTEYYVWDVLNSDAQLGIFTSCDPEGQGLYSTWLIKDVKIELGEKPTDWTPAPEDVSSSLSRWDLNLYTWKRVS